MAANVVQFISLYYFYCNFLHCLAVFKKETQSKVRFTYNKLLCFLWVVGLAVFVPNYFQWAG